MKGKKMNRLFINFKTYAEGTGKNALELAKKAEAAANKTGKEIVLVVQPTDIRLLSKAVSLKIFSQHIDPVECGAFTGSILPEAVKEAGASGTALNHAENRRGNSFIQKAVERASSIGLKTMLCAESLERAKELAEFAPSFIAFEPAELIGGDVSVSSSSPEIISGCAKALSEKGIPLIVGAGIKNSRDVKKSLELGAKGVFVASGIVKDSSPEKRIEELSSSL